MLQMTAISILVIFLSLGYSAQLQEKTPAVCPRNFPCRGLGNLGPPFFNSMQKGCGLIEVDCYHRKIKPGNDSQWYDVRTISDVRYDTIEIRDNLLQKHLESRSCDSFRNITFPSSPGISYTIDNMATFIRCTGNSKVTANYFSGHYNYTGCTGYSLYYTPYGTYTYDDNGFYTIPPNCSVIEMPAVRSMERKYSSDPFQIITANYTVYWYLSDECVQCSYTGGQCSTNNHQELHCVGGNMPKRGTYKGVLTKILIGTFGTFGGTIVILIVVVFSLRKKIAMKWRKKKDHHRDVKNFEKNYDSLTPKRYHYSDIKKMTNSFKDKLGEGGYGSVYKGKLCNGRLVAVKVLKELKGDGEEFFNEVASISQTSHVNVVSLLGFCFEGRKRALLYEFMPNGSLEKFVYNRISSTNRQLDWDKFYRIAIGIARGLEYLHRGCNTRILHFDIKPHNILLDEDFVPKISDFGLAKLCPGKESTVSMPNARGTIGYIAPEVICPNFGRVSHKSDVYSYGMMVLEMVGERENIEVDVGHTSEIYFPDWIYRKLESDKELGIYGIMNEDENAYARKMIIVSLWCIQSDPSTRPSMSRVVEMLEGRLESLEIPPKPVLSSPQVSPTHSSTIEIS